MKTKNWNIAPRAIRAIVHRGAVPAILAGALLGASSLSHALPRVITFFDLDATGTISIFDSANPNTGIMNRPEADGPIDYTIFTGHRVDFTQTILLAVSLQDPFGTPDGGTTSDTLTLTIVPNFAAGLDSYAFRFTSDLDNDALVPFGSNIDENLLGPNDVTTLLLAQPGAPGQGLTLNPDAFQILIFSSVPEPPTSALTAVALLVLGWFTGRKRFA